MKQWRTYLTPCFWLILPVFALNLALTRDLPAPFQPDIFWREIPAAIAWPEKGFRIILFTLTGFLPIRLRGTGVRLGWWLFGIGMIAYTASWAALILTPEAGWATGIVGFTAPAWTPAIWLAGISLIADRPAFCRISRILWHVVFAGLAFGFVGAHIAHASLVYFRLD